MKAGHERSEAVKQEEIDAVSESDGEEEIGYPEEVGAEVGENVKMEEEGEVV